MPRSVLPPSHGAVTALAAKRGATSESWALMAPSPRWVLGRRTRGRSAAEDTVQQTLLQIHAARHRFVPGGALEAVRQRPVPRRTDRLPFTIGVAALAAVAMFAVLQRGPRLFGEVGGVAHAAGRPAASGAWILAGTGLADRRPAPVQLEATTVSSFAVSATFPSGASRPPPP